jgi:hypothetical protein
MSERLLGWAMKSALCCVWFAAGAACASDQQVIVEGGHRAGEVVRTSGHGVPLLHALEQVVPTSYSVNVPNAGAWADVPVSWRAGGSLVHVLADMLSVNPSLQARIDTDLRLVTVTAHAPLPGAEAAPALAASPAKAEAPANNVANNPANSAENKAANNAENTADNKAVPPLLAQAAPAAPSQPSVVASASSVAAPPPPPPTPPAENTVWQMRTSDGSVRNALARWADEAGWQFIWDVPTDFTVDATATIHGTLDEALHQVVSALANSQVPIQVVLYKGNRVLRVIPKGAS